MLAVARRCLLAALPRTASCSAGEFFALALFATLGMMVMISANHFLTLYLGLELMSLSLYAMVALQATPSAPPKRR